MEIVKYNGEYFEVLEFTKGIFKEFPEFHKTYMLNMLTNDNIYAVKKDGNILCLIGYNEYIRGHFSIFITPTPYLFKYKNSCSRTIKKFLIDSVKEQKPLRVETESFDSDYLDIWHEWLGFEKEGVKKNYIGKRDYIMWRLKL